MLQPLPPPPPRRAALAPSTSRRRRWLDRLGGGAVRTGGLVIIASVLGILLFIAAETLPLLRGARVTVGAPRPASFAGDPAAAALMDEYRSTVASLGADGGLRLLDLAAGTERPGRGTGLGPLERVAVTPGAPAFVAATADGRVALARLRWDPQGHGATRTMDATLDPPAVLPIDETGRPVGAFAGALVGDGGAAAVAQVAGGQLVLARRSVEQNAITGEETVSSERTELPGAGKVTALAIDETGRHVWAGTSEGGIIYWPVADGVPGPPQRSDMAGGSPVTALSLLIGHRSLVSGHADGTVRVWLLVRGDATADGTDAPARPHAVRSFVGGSVAVRAIVPAPRDKGFLALAADGTLGLHHSTAHRTLWTGTVPGAAASGVAFGPKGDGAVVVGSGGVVPLAIDNPHPEVSLEALFAPVWYEGYDRPAYVWQSSSGTDDFEPKLSLTPLLFGTLKGTFYSLFLAIPLGVLGAMYTSQFMHHRLKQVVKPVVEIMAALPSVVLGFLAGLWLAPRIEALFPALLLMLLVLPLLTLASAALFRALPHRVRGRFPSGTEALLAIGFLAAGIWFCVAVEPAFERALFGGPFQGWLRDTTGLTYDQRNAIVVGLAMGFAVIPIIFSVAEEAFSNVPRGLVAGSLALGASRWQTVTRVVLPSASPGIFSAVMIGFGRAVGETMIVLMATGNTPIMDWSPFNGFRTLSANIAVEIPEAARGATLYRTLFLAGLLLFAVTFAVNTAADVVRQNLRRRYSNL